MVLDCSTDSANLKAVLGWKAASTSGPRRARGPAIGRTLILALLAFGLSSVFQLAGSVNVHADELSELTNPSSEESENADQAASPEAKAAVDQCLKNVATPVLMPGLHRVMQLVNCSNQTLLGASNAAQNQGFPARPVLPREGTWVMKPEGSPNSANVLTIDIPILWENTKCPANSHGMCQGITGPRFWSRTGCRYDIDFDKAQCETGGCAGRYDCSEARQSNAIGTTIAEWTLNEPVQQIGDPKNNFCSGNDGPPPVGQISYCKDSPDISAVDGVNVNMDIEPLGGSAHDPFDVLGGHDIQWLAEQYPLTTHGEDMRADTDCNVAPFRFRRSSLTGSVSPALAFVIVDKNGNPEGGDSTISCFSNCAKYAFPQPPAESCNEKVNTNCYLWKSFCLGDPSKYGPPGPPTCRTDADCPVAGACWDQRIVGMRPPNAIDHTCQGRAFVTNSDCFPLAGGLPNPLCPQITYPYGYIDPKNQQQFFSTQPPVGKCSDVSAGSPSPPPAGFCIGDDTLHKVMPKAYTWPNDPQVYGGDSPGYRVIFSPGGTKEKITPPSSIPFCDTLPGASTTPNAPNDVYNYGQALVDCGNQLAYGATFGEARPAKVSKWSCDPDPTGSLDDGVVCKWRQSLDNKIFQIGLRANFNQAASSLPLAVPPSATTGDMLLAAITFYNLAGSPTPPNGWAQVPGATVGSKYSQQTTVWYHFVANGDPFSYTWNWPNKAYPAGGLSVWRGVNSTDPFEADVKSAAATKLTNKGTVAFALAPSIKITTANARLVSVFGAGTANLPHFALPSGGEGIGIDETAAVKLDGGLKGGTYYASSTNTRIVSSDDIKNGTRPQSLELTQTDNPPLSPGVQPYGDWTAISFGIRPATKLKGHR